MRARAILPVLSATCIVWFAVEYCRMFTNKLQRPDRKLILTWVPFFGDPYYYFGGGGPDRFQAAGCEVTTCEIIQDKHRFPLEEYDALLFHAFENYEALFGEPLIRTPEQYYIFMTVESAKRSPIPDRRSYFYNITMSYRLDSDIPWPYYAVVNKNNGKHIAPAINPAWDYEAMDHWRSNKELDSLIKGKTRMAAWFASNCNSKSGREQYVKELQMHGLEVDIYGSCGSLDCPQDKHKECVELIGRKYYYYLAFENSLCEDYVTEKVLTALIGGAVPVLLSGANLTRFLPPNTYIDASKLSPRDIAVKLNAIVSKDNMEQYTKMFWWKDTYYVENRGPGHIWPSGKHPFCELCAVLNGNQTIPPRDIKKWWHLRSDTLANACT